MTKQRVRFALVGADVGIGNHDDCAHQEHALLWRQH